MTNTAYRVGYTILAWGVFVIGAIHIASTPRFYRHFGMTAMWFLSAGLLLMLLAALNLLCVRYATVASGIRTVCVVANVVVLGFVIAVAATLSVSPNVAGLVGLMVLLTLFSMGRRLGPG